jgi:hypothetical protein
VLRQVGLVEVREVGKQRHYRLNGLALKPIHDWTKSFEHLWNQRLDRLEDYLKQLSWQIIPTRLMELLSDPDRVKAGGVMQAMLKMKKIDVDVLQQA